MCYLNKKNGNNCITLAGALLALRGGVNTCYECFLGTLSQLKANACHSEALAEASRKKRDFSLMFRVSKKNSHSERSEESLRYHSVIQNVSEESLKTIKETLRFAQRDVFKISSLYKISIKVDASSLILTRHAALDAVSQKLAENTFTLAMAEQVRHDKMLLKVGVLC